MDARPSASRVVQLDIAESSKKFGDSNQQVKGVAKEIRGKVQEGA